jgi:hypothetical protein
VLMMLAMVATSIVSLVSGLALLSAGLRLISFQTSERRCQ